MIPGGSHCETGQDCKDEYALLQGLDGNMKPGAEERSPAGWEMAWAYCKLEIFLPASHLEALREALRRVDAGHIGRYDSCLSYHPVTSCWRPLEGANPYLGDVGDLCTQPELKVEVTCRTRHLEETLAAIRAAHPYEEPVINVIPLLATGLDME